ncbi:hypothetical protein V6N11_029460 [Hibiscus sabdariffa]|uniref:Uncharacterized protein n=1 Tax=Hibiscus sabdariffa TaxID=183260 RepID=A0ABR2P778_9ROSI
MEIQQEAYSEPETIQPKDAKQTAALDLSKRLQDFRTLNDASSLKALEEWRKRKMKRARQRELEKNGTQVTKEKVVRYKMFKESGDALFDRHLQKFT